MAEGRLADSLTIPRGRIARVIAFCSAALWSISVCAADLETFDVNTPGAWTIRGGAIYIPSGQAPLRDAQRCERSEPPGSLHALPGGRPRGAR